FDVLYLFFFSSRRRHTRFDCDWSSDVCSSDLVTKEDLEKPMTFYRQARSEENFEAGIESALSSILVSPEFLFRVEEDPARIPPRSEERRVGKECRSRWVTG